MYAGFRSLTTLFPQILISIGHARRAMWISIILALVLPVAFYVGTRWGTGGVALAWMVAYPLLVVPLLVVHTLRVIGLSGREYLGALWPAISATTVMTVAVLLASWLIPPRLGNAPALVVEVGVGAASVPGDARLVPHVVPARASSNCCGACAREPAAAALLRRPGRAPGRAAAADQLPFPAGCRGGWVAVAEVRGVRGGARLGPRRRHAGSVGAGGSGRGATRGSAGRHAGVRCGSPGLVAAPGGGLGPPPSPVGGVRRRRFGAADSGSPGVRQGHRSQLVAPVGAGRGARA